MATMRPADANDPQGDFGYSPLSMTCSVGNCLYNITNTTGGAIDFGDTVYEKPRGESPYPRCLPVQQLEAFGAAHITSA